MNLRVRDNLLYGFHRALATAGMIRAPSLDDIRRDGFERVLVVATTAIGDALLCSPLLDSLRAAKPSMHLGLWVSEAALPLFEGRDGLDAVIPYHGKYRRAGEARERLRRERFDLALVANANDPDVIPMIWWSGCRRIIRRPQRHTIYSFMVANPDMLSRSHTTGHAIERNLEFCDLLGIPRGEARTRIHAKPGAESKARELLTGAASPWRIVHPGSSRAEKQWSAENFAAIARRIVEAGPGVVVLTGSAGEKALCDEVQLKIGLGHRVRNLAGELRLDELAALFREAKLLVSGDTGPFHIAMAVGTPTVTLFAPWDPGSSPEINGPYFNREKHLVVQTARMGDGIETISLDAVWRVVQRLGDGGGGVTG